MGYSIEPTDRIYVKGYGYLPFPKNMSNKYYRKILDTAKISTKDAMKSASKRVIKKQQKQLVM